MASKNKQGGSASRGDSGTPPRQEVDRLIAKGWFKDAVKQAKICQRDHPTVEHHQLLERAYLLRAQELNDGKMATAAREVVGHLLNFGLTDSNLTEPLIALMIAVGMTTEALKFQQRLDSPEAIERLTRHAADQAVLHPERPAASAEILEGAKRIRTALEALVAGDEAGALERLRDVSRASPFADWRLFARGLAASRKGEDGEARTSWDRLDPARAASRIARSLVAMTDSVAPPVGSPAQAQLDKLERWAFGGPLLGPLENLRDAAAKHVWTEVIQKLSPVRLTLRQFDPSQTVRLTQALISPLIHDAMDLDFSQARDLVQRFTKAADPLPFDPRWHRLWALLWEGPQGNIEEAEPFWRRYLDELGTVPAIRSDDHNRVKGLILTHIGKEYSAYAAGAEEGGPPSRKVDPQVERDRRQAIKNFEESLKCLPDHRATYQALMDVFEDADRPDQVAEAAMRLIKILPDDFEALNYLSIFHLSRDEPAQSLEFILRVRKQKPLDRKIITREWEARFALAREHALARRWDLGRAELATAEGLDPEKSGKPHFFASKVALEIKAGRPDLASEIIADALERLPESATLRLALAIEARRFKLPKNEIALADIRWKEEIPKRVRSATAGGLAELLIPFLVRDIKYPKKKEHVDQVVTYLKRTSQIKYGRDDLFYACSFLTMNPKQREFCQRLTKRGLKLFPNAPEFPMMLGAFEIEKGPYRGNLRLARTQLDLALKLALPLEATDRRAAELIPRIKETLSGLDGLTTGFMGMPFPFASSGPSGPSGMGMSSPREMLDALAGMLGGIDPEGLFDPMDDDGEDDDYDDFDGDDDDPEPTPQPKTKRRKR